MSALKLYQDFVKVLRPQCPKEIPKNSNTLSQFVMYQLTISNAFVNKQYSRMQICLMIFRYNQTREDGFEIMSIWDTQVFCACMWQIWIEIRNNCSLMRTNVSSTKYRLVLRIMWINMIERICLANYDKTWTINKSNDRKLLLIR